MFKTKRKKYDFFWTNKNVSKALYKQNNELNINLYEMKIDSLQRKRALRTALLILLLNVAGMGKGYAYDFSAVCETGQTLYYSIIDASNHFVELTCPGTVGYYGWSGYPEPKGNIVFPESVQYDGAFYIVTSI